jgi:hypothetical protein
MLIQFKWKDCDLCGADAFWLEATEQEARKQISPLLNNDTIAASEELARGSEAFAAIMGCPERTFCFLVSCDLTFIRPFKAGYPVHQLWNGYSPFEEIDPIEIIQISEIKNTEESAPRKDAGSN